ncbi:MAG: manganese efflux pump MntP family protein [Clostridia bacterium]|nr:manganese efflux pump MntP family protein [Clostridia bacterium]
MWVVQSIFLALGLAMDATCVSMSNALAEKNMRPIKIILSTLLYGIFQTVMPIIGYFVGATFEKQLKTFIPLIALVLLSIIGLKSIIETIVDIKKRKANGDEVTKEKKIGVGELFIQAIATSIDALSIGVIFIAEPYNITTAMISFVIIGIITWGLSLLGFFIGKKFGKLLKNSAPIIGGIVLILIGLKIFIPSVI